MSALTFKGDEAHELLRDKRILIFGDSNMRALYKDLLWLMYDGTLIPDGKLKDKNELSFAEDVRISNGKVHPGTNYVEIREYNLNPFIKYQFITRLFLDGFRLEIENWEQPPDVIVLGSCMWDLSRWGPSGVDDYKENVVKTFYFLKGKFPTHTQIIWTTSLPPTSKCQGGFLNKNIEFLRETLPFQVFEGNVYSSRIAKEHKIDVLDLHYRFKYMMEGHTPDGIHWKSEYVRYATNMLLTHLANSWNRNIYKSNKKYPAKRPKNCCNNNYYLRFISVNINNSKSVLGTEYLLLLIPEQIMARLIVASSLLLILASVAASSPSRSTRASCTITGSSIDDVANVKASCTSIVVKDLTVPAGKALDLSDLKTGTTVTFDGTLTFAYAEWNGPLISIGGTSITVTRATDHIINGQGAKWWDGLGSNGGVTKPLLIQFHKLDNSIVENIYIKNSARHTVSIVNCNNLTIAGMTIDNSDGDSQGGHNTDGFDVSQSDQITIKNSKVYNQDDCLAVNSGTNYYFINNYCSGGHGISIAAIGGTTDYQVKNVQVTDCTIANSDNGVRIKTNAGATGLVSGIVYKNIVLENIRLYGISIRGDYLNSGCTGTPTTGFPVQQLTFSNIYGTVASSAVPIYVLLADGAASSWSWSGIKITGSSKSNYCVGITSTVSC